MDCPASRKMAEPAANQDFAERGRLNTKENQENRYPSEPGPRRTTERVLCNKFPKLNKFAITQPDRGSGDGLPGV